MSSSLSACGGPIVRKAFGGSALAKGTAVAFLVPRGGALFDWKQKQEVASSHVPAVNGDAKSIQNGETRMGNGWTRWMVAAVTSIYVIYPVSLLLLFRISETISALRLFEHHHRCHQLGETGHCVQLFAIHGSQFLAWVGLTLSYRRRDELPVSFAGLLALISAVTLGVYKGMVDGYLLFDPNAVINHRNNLAGTVAVVTGSNRGIGLETARSLAKMGAHVVMTCRSLSKCRPVVDGINSDDKIPGSASAAVLDLNSLESAALLANQLTRTYPTIDYVFCNAGTTPQYNLTHDGFEDAFGGMHLNHMALVLGLLSSLTNGNKDDEPSRVIMVSSEMAVNAAIGLFSPGDPSLTGFYAETNVRGESIRGDGTFPASLPAYGRAKLANILFALELNRRMAAKSEEDGNMRPVIAHAVHTGAVNTESSCHSIRSMFSETWPKWLHPGLGWLVGNVYFPLLWRPVQGGARVLLCAALSQSDVILRGGQYLDALCHPFLPLEEEASEVLQSVESGDIHEDAVTIKRWDVTIELDPIQALQLADARWSRHLYEMSLDLLKQSPAKSVVELAP